MIALLSFGFARGGSRVQCLGLGRPHRVREMRREGLAREAGGADRRLLDVDPLAVDVGRGQDQRRGRADRRDDVALGRLVAAELEHVVARDLRIVGREVARLLALIMVASASSSSPRSAGGSRRSSSSSCRWQVKQAISSSACGRDRASATPGAERVAAGLGARARHQLGARRLEVEVAGCARIDAVLDQLTPAIRAWDRRSSAGSARGGRSSSRIHSKRRRPSSLRSSARLLPLRRRGRARGEQVRLGVGGAVAVACSRSRSHWRPRRR